MLARELRSLDLAEEALQDALAGNAAVRRHLKRRRAFVASPGRSEQDPTRSRRRSTAAANSSAASAGRPP
jgi:hypothetical protein